MPLRFPKIWFLFDQGSSDSPIQIGLTRLVIRGSLALTLLASSFAIFSRFSELILTFFAFSVTNKAPSLGSNIFIKMTHDDSFNVPPIYRNSIFGGFNSSNPDDVMGKSQKIRANWWDCDFSMVFFLIRVDGTATFTVDVDEVKSDWENDQKIGWSLCRWSVCHTDQHQTIWLIVLLD